MHGMSLNSRLIEFTITSERLFWGFKQAMLIGHIQFRFEDDSKYYAKSTVMPKYIFHKTSNIDTIWA